MCPLSTRSPANVCGYSLCACRLLGCDCPHVLRSVTALSSNRSEYMHKSTNTALLELSQTLPREAVAKTGSFHVTNGGLTSLCLSIGLFKALARPAGGQGWNWPFQEHCPSLGAGCGHQVMARARHFSPSSRESFEFDIWKQPKVSWNHRQ